MPSVITRGAISVKSLGFGAAASTAGFIGYMTDGLYLNTFGVTADSSGNMYINSRGNSTGALGVLKLDKSGTVQWSKVFNSTANIAYTTVDQGSTLIKDSSNNLYVIGDYTTSSPTYAGFVKINSSGTLLNQAMVSSTYAAQAKYIYIDGSGNIYVAYREYDTTVSSYRSAISKLNSSLTMQWSRTYDDASAYTANAVSVAADSSGNVYAASWEFAYSYIEKFNSSGTLQWTKEIVGSNMRVYGLACDSGGNVYALGALGALMKIDSSGAIVWQKKWDFGGSTVSLTSIYIDASDNIYIAGSYNNGAKYIAAIIKYNTSGTVQWQRTLQYGSGIISSMASADANFIYVIGNSSPQADGSSFAKLPSDGSKTGTYTVGARSYTYSAGSLTETTPTYTIAAKTLTQTSPSYSTASYGATLTNVSYTQQVTIV